MVEVLGSKLVDKFKKELELLGIPYDDMHVTISETKEDLVLFFKKFPTITHNWPDRHVNRFAAHFKNKKR